MEPNYWNSGEGKIGLEKHTTTHTYTTHNNKKRVWYIDEISELMST